MTEMFRFAQHDNAVCKTFSGTLASRDCTGGAGHVMPALTHARLQQNRLRARAGLQNLPWIFQAVYSRERSYLSLANKEF
jgi:hypothetical protein